LGSAADVAVSWIWVSKSLRDCATAPAASVRLAPWESAVAVDCDALGGLGVLEIRSGLWDRGLADPDAAPVGA
jgi:hypothetical protein